MTIDITRIDVVRQQYRKAGQDHVFTFWNELSEQEQEQFLHQLESLDPAALSDIYTQAIAASKNTSTFNDLTPLDKDEVESTLTATEEEKNEWNSLGLEAIANNQVAVILLAGGQGTRLGSLLPKGCYRNIGLPSRKTLFQLQAERIQKLQNLARIHKADRTGQPLRSVPAVVIPWCIMTSGPTQHHTEVFLKEHNYFGLSIDNIIIFEQGVVPCFDTRGKFMLNQKNMIATAPNGNGGLYWALHSEGVLDELQKRGVKYVHSYSVDNILIKAGDPVGIGHAIKAGADVTAKVMPKTMAKEPLGVICRQAGKIKAVEYSELDPRLAALVDPKTGEFVYRAGNICNQIYSLDFLQRIPAVLQTKDQDLLTYHLASKRIPYVDLVTGHRISPDKPNGVKLELFIFDVFPLAERFGCLEVERFSEFSPMKNASGLDSPHTSRRDLERLHIRWIEEAGGHVQGEDVDHLSKANPGTEARIGFEIGPLLSYAGEGLEWVRGKTLLASVLESREDAQFVKH
ncbi:UDP-N-acetylglucosamine pyrophosphorylase [Mortierella polycephala]|uniref:UDP-N-acetylglucosamine diphosphorylase n=1 Tax=Mortierella polycephala TaxID=41804 RepID=A0A9P6U399_9FUNG|nr:UDP-N-acetylglucosamine pyrophosphorylase [Mortierella polycephala]